MRYLRRDSVYKSESRRGTAARGTRPTGRNSHLTEQLPPIKRYVYGESKPDSRPEIPRSERADRATPERHSRPTTARKLQNLQHAHRPLTTAELLPGLWAEQIIETKSWTGNYSNPGLLAVDRREPARLVLWVPKPDGLVRSHFILGPGYTRDESFPVHEIWPIDPDYFTTESRKLLIAYAERSVYNPDRGEFEINP